MHLDETQAAIRDLAHKFSSECLGPTAASRDISHTFPREELRQMGELGLMGMLVPQAYGGSDVGAVAYVAALEEIAAGDGACSTIVSVHNSVGCGPIVKFGTETQKRRFLPKLASGEWIAGFALTEPQAGSDASDLRTRARLEGDHYVISGTKQFITSGKNADVIIVFAVTDPSAGKKGISAFIVPTSTAGYHVVRVETKLGQRASDTCQLVFEEMRIPIDCRLGPEGAGYGIALANLEGGRIGIAAQAIGMARAAFEAARDYARERKTFGQAITKHQAIGFRLASMATEIEAARQLTLHAASMREVGVPCLTEACMAKLFASEMAERVVSAALQIFGGNGYIADYAVERIYRDVRVCQIYEGTSDIQRLVIARAVA